MAGFFAWLFEWAREAPLKLQCDRCHKWGPESELKWEPREAGASDAAGLCRKCQKEVGQKEV